MEKTIEERAENIYKGNTIEQDAYVKGATDQREIDIKKACEWLKENVEKYLYNIRDFEDYTPTCGGKLFTDFKKAMEENK